MISVTSAARYLRGDPDHATLVVPERAIGALTTVNTMLTRMQRLVRVVEDDQRRRARDAADHDATASRRRILRNGEAEGSHESPGGHGSHLMTDIRIARRVLGGVVNNPITRRLMRFAGTGIRAVGGGTLRMGGLRLFGALGSVIGGYDLYRQASTSGQVSVLDGAMTGAGIGGTIGTFFGPVVGTSIGAAIGGAVGAVGAMAYNSSDSIVAAWRSATGWMGRGADAAIRSTTTAWHDMSTGLARMGTTIGATLQSAWDGAVASFHQYRDRMGDWISTQAHHVGEWLDGIVHQLQASINSFSLHAIAAAFVEKLKNWILSFVGLGGGGGGSPGGDGAAPQTTPSGRREGDAVPSGRGRPATREGTVRPDEPPAHAQYQTPDTSTPHAPAAPATPATAPASTPARHELVTPAGRGRPAVYRDVPATGSQAATPHSDVAPATRSTPLDHQAVLGAAHGTSGMTPGGATPHDETTGGIAHAAPMASPGGGTVRVTGEAPRAAGPVRFAVTGSALAAGVDHVNSHLVEANREASRFLPPGYRVEMYSGYRAGDRRFHGRGMAADFAIYDDKGNRLDNYQSQRNFRTYERFAQDAHAYIEKHYPDEASLHRFGGYFGGAQGPGGTYGANDIMHQDMGGAHVGMAAGSWAKGLTSDYRGIFDMPSSPSIGMNQRKEDPTTTVLKRNPDPSLAERTFLGRPMPVPGARADAPARDGVGFVSAGADFKKDWNPGHAVSEPDPKPASLPSRASVDHGDDAGDDAPTPPKAKTHKRHASLDDIPTVHPDARLTIGSHTDKYA